MFRGRVVVVLRSFCRCGLRSGVHIIAKGGMLYLSTSGGVAWFFLLVGRGRGSDGEGGGGVQGMRERMVRVVSWFSRALARFPSCW